MKKMRPAFWVRGLLLFTILLLNGCSIEAQEKFLKTCILGFYNLENFYDTINNPMVNDDEFTPEGMKHYGQRIYEHKVANLASVILRIGETINPLGPLILGVAEIENDTVLKDLVKHPIIAHRHYQIIHFNSKDARGIDVGFLYQPAFFIPELAYPLSIPLNNGETYFTRDILYVKGKLIGETIHLLVNHWPSKRSGEEKSAANRNLAASICRKQVDAILSQDPKAVLFVMGDFNDDPNSVSISKILQAEPSFSSIDSLSLYNPFYSIFKKGVGTLANRDAWGLFDQIICSRELLNQNRNGLRFYQAGIFQAPFLKESQGKYAGYPMRTWDGNHYRGGFSDHFPSFLVLTRKIK